MTTSAEPCAVVIFGATGDLTQRKLSPALYNLAAQGAVSVAVIGVGRREKTTEEFREDFRTAVEKFSRTPFSENVWNDFSQAIYYHKADFDSDISYRQLGELLKETEKKHGTEGNALFYLAMPPELFGKIAAKIKDNVSVKGWSRLVIEKPFGTDLKSAREINRTISSAFGDDSVFRIDHYMGKSLVENIMTLRFANDVFEPLWNRKYIDHVQITVSESGGVESRGKYYETVGALKDMVQNHMLQVLTLIAMEPPASLDADDVKDEKVKVLRALKKLSAANVALGQYGSGVVAGANVPGYREEENVNPQSATENFAALKLEINNMRWAGVPFYMRTGKRMPENLAKICVQFRRASGLFDDIEPNLLMINIQPKEGISIQFNFKTPGTKPLLVPVRMDFSHAGEFGNTPEAYERLLYDAIANDRTLFTRWEEIENAWKFIDDIASDDSLRAGFPNYAAGTWGPAAADELIKGDGRTWIN